MSTMTAEVAEATGGDPPRPRIRALQINSADGVRRWVLRVARRVELGDLDPKRGNCCLVAANVVLDALAQMKTEGELEQLKEQLRRATDAAGGIQ